MIKKYVFGTPLINTEAVITTVAPETGKQNVFKEVLISREEGEKEWALRYTMSDEDIIYGLGENVRGINKRGFSYTSRNIDNADHNELTHSLYGSQNFFIISGERELGVFFDIPGEITFDVGYTAYDELLIIPKDPNFELYLIYGDSPDMIVHEFRGITGRSYIPPKWAFGYGQSRWGYKCEADVRKIAKEHRERHIPLDSIYLDIDYMDDYKDFTVDKERFPDLAGLVDDMKAQHIHLVPIIDAGVKKEEGYFVYEEGRKNGYFCKDESGEDFVVGVWPGRSCLPDMLNREAREWFGSKYKLLLDMGIDGFWNDMNEPAIFYSEEGLKKLFETFEEYRDKNLGAQTFFELMEKAGKVQNSEKDLEAFYHNIDGQQVNHRLVHNLYGYYMTRAAGEAFAKLAGGRRILMFSRSSYIGMHRYGGMWQGDNKSCWSHLLMSMQMLPALNMSGFLYVGADIGGFIDDTTEDLMARWLALAVFIPLMRNHSTRGTRQQELFRFKNEELLSGLAKVRYMLLPYLYSEFMKAALNDTMLFRPLGFVYPKDSTARRIEDQMLVGDNIMIAPVTVQNAAGRPVYVPEPMHMIRIRNCVVIEETRYEKGYTYVEMPLTDICIFIRDGRKLMLAPPAECVEEVDYGSLSWYHAGECGEPQHYELYDDDGISVL